MSDEEKSYKKRNWLIRTVNVLSELEVGVLYSAPNVREILRENHKDAISYRTIQRLLDAIVKAQKIGLKFEEDGKWRILVTRQTADDDNLYEIIEQKIEK